MSEEYLVHHGVLGMKWGVRHSTAKTNHQAVKTRKAELKTQYQNDKGPKRYKVLNAANSAARSYYRSNRTANFKTYQKERKAKDRKEARLTTEQIQGGRYRVARARNIKRKAGSTLAGLTVAAALAGSGGAAAPILATVGGMSVGAISNYASGGHYYAMEKRAYGDVHAKYQAKEDAKKSKV